MNSLDIEKSNNNNINISNKQNSNKNISIQKGFSILFDSNKISKSIISKIEHLMSIYKYNKIKLYYSLNKIENYVNNLLKKSDSGNNKKISPSNNKDTEKLNKSNNENIGEEKEQEIGILQRKINKLIQKQNEIENNFKIERFRYLFCIGENQKQIKELKKRLNLLTIDKMPKNELNKVICFPNYTKFDITDEINPKSIPMYLTKNKKTQTPKIIPRNNSQKPKRDTNFDFNQFFKTELKRYRNNISFSMNNSYKKEDNNKNDTLGFEKEEEGRKIIGKENKLKDIDDTIKLGQKYFEEHIPEIDKFFTKKKNYFLSHPKLNYIKDIGGGGGVMRWKVGNQINSLPQQIAKLKTVSRSKKNTIVVFPSFLNETLLNLEKLKNNKNFRSIDNKFEDIYKIKLKSHD